MTLPATDNFNRASVDPIGGNWTTVTGSNGNLRIISNTAITASAVGSAPRGAYWNADTFGAFHYAQCTYVDAQDGTEGPAIHIQSGSFSGYVAGIRSNATIRMQRFDSGAETQLVEYGSLSLTTASVVRIRRDPADSKLYISVDGVDLGAGITDATYSGGAAGMFCKYAAGQYDNWEAGDVGGGAAANPPYTPLRQLVPIFAQ